MLPKISSHDGSCESLFIFSLARLLPLFFVRLRRELSLDADRVVLGLVRPSLRLQLT